MGWGFSNKREDYVQQRAMIEAEIIQLETFSKGRTFSFLKIIFFWILLCPLCLNVPIQNEFKKLAFGIFLLIAIIFSVYLIYSSFSMKKRLKFLKSKQEEIWKRQNETEYTKQNLQFLDELEKSITIIQESTIQQTTSSLTLLWDRITRCNKYNPKALICPVCFSNNGLSNKVDNVHYICPVCKNHVTKTEKYKIHEE